MCRWDVCISSSASESPSAVKHFDYCNKNELDEIATSGAAFEEVVKAIKDGELPIEDLKNELDDFGNLTLGVDFINENDELGRSWTFSIKAIDTGN